MSDFELSILNSLQTFGLTSNEAKIFFYLVQNPNSNGYEISKNTGISRSLVYGALEKLRSNGFIELTQSKTSSYIAKPIDEIWDDIRKRAKNARDHLQKQFQSLPLKPSEDLFITLPDRKTQIKKLSYLVRNTKNLLYISAGMRELNWIKKDLLSLPKDVQVHIFSFTDVEELSERFHTYSKGMDLSYIQSEEQLKDKWRIMLIKDKEEMLLCGGDTFERGLGIYTKNNMMVQFSIEHFMHDVKIYNIERKYNINDDTHLQL